MTRALRLLAALAGICLLMALPHDRARAQETTEDDLRIGVRTDAEPFSYRISALRPAATRGVPGGPLAAKGYDGYVVRICDATLTDLRRQHPEIRPVIVPIEDAGARFDSLRDGSIDILCDPATITDDRLDGLFVSAPIYLSGITFATQPNIRDLARCSAIVGVVGSTTSETVGLQSILQSGEWPQYADSLQRFVDNPSSWVGDPACNGTDKPFIAVPTHDQLAAKFCAHEVFYYVGDVEIVNRTLNSHPECPFVDGAVTYTEERYAIFGHAPDQPSQKAVLVLKFFETLSRLIHRSDSVLLTSFDASFPGYTASRKLQALFWALTGTFPGATGSPF